MESFSLCCNCMIPETLLWIPVDTRNFRKTLYCISLYYSSGVFFYGDVKDQNHGMNGSCKLSQRISEVKLTQFMSANAAEGLRECLRAVAF